jgi:hypothetical protein
MRATVFLLSLGCVLFGPWWGILIGVTALSLRYRAFEMVLLGVIADVLWLPASFALGVPLFTLATLTIVWLFEPLRRELFVTP